MKRRLTLPSSALLAKEEEDPKRRKEKVGEKEEERDVEEGLASISSNHSTGSISKIWIWLWMCTAHIEQILQGRESVKLRMMGSVEGERRGRGRRRRGESRKGSSSTSPSPSSP